MPHRGVSVSVEAVHGGGVPGVMGGAGRCRLVVVPRGTAPGPTTVGFTVGLQWLQWALQWGLQWHHRETPKKYGIS